MLNTDKYLDDDDEHEGWDRARRSAKCIIMIDPRGRAKDTQRQMIGMPFVVGRRVWCGKDV